MSIHIGVANEKSERVYKDATDWELADGTRFIEIRNGDKPIIWINADAVLTIRKGE